MADYENIIKYYISHTVGKVESLLICRGSPPTYPSAVELLTETFAKLSGRQDFKFVNVTNNNWLIADQSNIGPEEMVGLPLHGININFDAGIGVSVPLGGSLYTPIVRSRGRLWVSLKCLVLYSAVDLQRVTIRFDRVSWEEHARRCWGG